VFGVAFVFTTIVLYDALNVRRSVGEQGVVLQELARGKTFFTSVGHRPIEVVAGSLIGVVVAAVMLQIL
jgi:acid phosphatase family membrane protein YuiD